jgi:trans-aconitate methyltransferase
MPNQDPIIDFYERYPFPNNTAGVDFVAATMRNLLHRHDRLKNVLAVGCGTGEEVMALCRALPHATVSAIEPSRPSAQLARERCPQNEIVNTTIEEFSGGRYDLVWCSGVLHHTQDPEGNLRRIRQWVAAEGELFIGLYHHARWDCTEIREDHSEAQARDATINPREVTYSWRSFIEMLERSKLAPVRIWHKYRLPVPHGRVMQAIYDGVWLYRRIQMVSALCKLIK